MSFLATGLRNAKSSRRSRQSIQTDQKTKRRSDSTGRGYNIESTPITFTLSSKVFKNSRSASRDFPKKGPMINSTPKSRRSASMRGNCLNTSSKIFNNRLSTEKSKKNNLHTEFISAWLLRAKSEIKSKNYEAAIKDINKVLKTDPDNLEALLIRADYYISTARHKSAIPDLLSIIQESPAFDRNIYIALAVCFVQIDDFNTAIRQLTTCISIFPHFAEGYLNRGLLYNRQKRWDKAVNDFHEAIALNPHKGSSYIGLSETFLGMNDAKSAINALKKACADPSSRSSAFLALGKLYCSQKTHKKALKALNHVLDIQKENPEAFYFKSLALSGLNQLADAALCLEQSIKYDLSHKYTGAAIYNLGTIKIKQKDYYGAMFTFQRAVEYGLEINEQKVLKSYVGAILYLMKRKFREGITVLSKIINCRNSVIQEYIGNCLAFRGYAHSALEEHEKAVKDLKAAGSMQVLEKASEYNLIVSTAVGLAEKDPYEALRLFEDAGKLFSSNIEPKVYMAAVNFSLAQSKRSQEFAMMSKELLDEANKLRENESDIYFFRGIVNYYLGNMKEAVSDIETAIDKSEDNVADHFIARGACSARLKMPKEAIQDFCIAIQLDEKSTEAYYYKGRCEFCLDETETAFEDFHKLAKLKPDSPEININAGNALMIIGSTEKALIAYQNASKLKPLAETFIQRAKCFLLLERLEDAIIELKKISEAYMSPQVNFDLQFLETLFVSHRGNIKEILIKTIKSLKSLLASKHEGNICKKSHANFYYGVFLFFLGDFQAAKAAFKQSINMTNDSDDTIEKDSIEILYNLGLIYIIGEAYESAYAHLSEIVHYLEGKDRGRVLLLMGILQLKLENAEGKALIEEAKRYDPETTQMYIDSNHDIKLLPLSSSSSFASGFPMAKVSILKSHSILIRPSFTFPSIEMPKMELEVEPGILKKFTVKTVKSKPETPWLNRVKGTIQFTDEIRYIENESIADSVEPQADEQSGEYSNATPKKYKSESVSLGELQELEGITPSGLDESENQEYE